MCRMIVFAGTCTRCNEAHTWEDLSQALLCLEAKNNGGIGDCANGVNIEQHKFDQECDRCSQEDEGLGGVGLYESPPKIEAKRGATQDATTSSSSKRQRT
ncbi:hypothetical protein NHJ13051_001947 [Beauveria bassiana]|uniref:Uncharacterized protein n=2 Tax=Beauveria bassiana TaxID=176275 RepID=A0A2N6NZT0_BEABA|nr:uncharacterized protein BBA_04469 [Beauveria bassiana ARSEF 2860]KAF1739316.1 hypothetical protein CRV24_001248 [Beauveria bassiana]EJP66529.1 hypothetical protein BBA_04469 [Beauveria bassiana ARSEF 2860]KAH8720165.1 hypothetical protein HC256_000570 [Beauveria bassiana]PMB72750.1 hypothetical protein BM221_000167 [Beauveria bassiana]PQK08428.1 hypothetical protein BB8028_0001g05040 [Beauveria bassiana]